MFSRVLLCFVIVLGSSLAKKSIIQKGFFEGDILLDKRALAVVNGRVSVANRVLLWSNGRVPYVIDNSLKMYQYEVSLIRQAIAVLQKESCVSYVPRTHEPHYVRFIRGNGCYSYVGRVPSIRDGQAISIGQGCAYLGVVMHEMMHSLGFFHTSSRPDRDSYVIVYYNNIQNGFQHNFRKYNAGTVSLLGSPYDLHSLMHLPRDSFSKNSGYTLQARAGASVALGQLNGLTPIDIQEINVLYQCTNNKGCYHSIGMQDKRIPDSSISASSYKQYFNAHQARLHLQASYKGFGTWCAGYSTAGQYLLVDLGHTTKISGVATQGRQQTFYDGAWVTSYTLQYKLLARSSWRSVYQYFTGNWDDNSVQFSSLTSPVYARYVKIVPQRWQSEMCMRIELYGCDG